MQVLDPKKAQTKQYFMDAAREQITAGCVAISDILSTLTGPSGALKLLTKSNDDSIMTNDGATLLGSLSISSPSAEVLINTAKAQDREEGDGTTTVALLASLIFQKCSLKIHPISLIRGLSIAREHGTMVLSSLKKKGDLHFLAKTTLMSKVVRGYVDKFARIAVLASLCERNSISILRLPGHLGQSFFLEKAVLLENDSEIPFLENPKILLANTQTDADRSKLPGSAIQTDSLLKLAAIEEAEARRMAEKAAAIASSRCDVFVNRQIIYDLPRMELLKRNIYPVGLASFDGIEKLHMALGGSILSTFDSLSEAGKVSQDSNDQNNVVSKDSNAKSASNDKKNTISNTISTCDAVFSTTLCGKKVVVFKGTKTGGTIVLRGSSKSVLDEAERALHDALCVLKNNDILPGGGATEAHLAKHLRSHANTLSKAESAGILACADALEELTAILANNCGLNSEDLKAMLRSANSTSEIPLGIDASTGEITDTLKKGIVESFSVKKRVFLSAIETAQTLLKVDGIIQAPPRERSRM